LSAFISYALFLSLFIYPLILILSWFYNEKVRIKEVLCFISTSKAALKLNIQMIEESKTLVFSPNIIGAFTAILAKHFEVLKIPEGTIIGLLISHFCLIVITAIGVAFLRMALTRVLLIFIGEILMSWALVGGSVLFVFQIYEFRGIVGNGLSSLLILVVVFFLFAYGYFRMKGSAEIYASGAEEKPRRDDLQDKFIVKVAHNLEEASDLAEAGFEKLDEFNGKHIYRKRK
jgi:hypothetical protein